MEIADRLKKLIRELGHSPASFADEVGVQRSSVSHVLNGRNKPGLDFIQKIAQHFPEMDVHWFVTGEVKRPANSVVSAPSLENSAAEKQRDSAVGEAPEKRGPKLIRVMLFYEDGTVNEFVPGGSLPA